MTREQLQRDEVRFGFPCAAGSEVDSFERSGVLSRDFVFRGVSLPAGSAFSHDVDFDFLRVDLSQGIAVHGIHVAADSVLQFPHWFDLPYSTVALLLLWPLLLVNGARAVSRGDVTIIPSRGLSVRVGELVLDVAPGDRLGCHRRGVSRLSLSSARKVGEDELAGGYLGFDQQGRWIRLMLYAPQEFRGQPVWGSGLVGTHVEMFPDGRLRRFTLAEPRELGGRCYARGTRVELDRAGAVVRSTPATKRMLWTHR